MPSTVDTGTTANSFILATKSDPPKALRYYFIWYPEPFKSAVQKLAPDLNRTPSRA
jgi:hypothetical protein